MLVLIIITVLLLIGIVTACTVFTNAIEWLGHRLNLSQGVVGSVLAAVGTALPETLVPIVAILSAVFASTGASQAAGHDIGVGAILGAPFMLTTLALFVTAVAIVVAWLRKRRSLLVRTNAPLFLLDMRYFFVAFGLAVFASVIPFGHWARIAVAVLLLGLYAGYLKTLFSHEDPALETDEETHLPRLFFAPRNAEPPTPLIVTQALLGVAGIILLAHQFVHQVEHLSHLLAIPAMILSLVIIPIATELPEKFNSLLWVQEGKDQLALGNLTGAMVFQSCIPTAIGVLFTPWQLTPLAWTSVLLAMLCALLVTLVVRFLPQRFWLWGFMAAGIGYVVFLARVLVSLPGSGAILGH